MLNITITINGIIELCSVVCVSPSITDRSWAVEGLPGIGGGVPSVEAAAAGGDTTRRRLPPRGGEVGGVRRGCSELIQHQTEPSHTCVMLHACSVNCTCRLNSKLQSTEIKY